MKWRCDDEMPCCRLQRAVLTRSRALSARAGQDGHPFTEAEQEQLRALFSCTEEELRTVLEASAYIFEQAAYQGMAAEPLYEFLLEAGFDDVHAKVQRSWHATGHARHLDCR